LDGARTNTEIAEENLVDEEVAALAEEELAPWQETGIIQDLLLDDEEDDECNEGGKEGEGDTDKA